MRKICVVTGTRAEYGLLCPTMKLLKEAEDIALQLIATGMHLSPEFGLTWKIIHDEGFAIDEKVEMLLSSDTAVGIAKSLGLGVIGFADAYERLKPDCVLLLGDRYEILAAAQAAYIHRIPIAHIGGGETTEGAMDEAIRHAISKMAHLHFTGVALYTRRVIQLGEDPERVFTVGATGLDAIKSTPRMGRDELEEELGFKLRATNFLVTYHPATLGESPEVAFASLLRALDRFPEAGVLFTYPNSDAGGRVLIDKVQDYVRENEGRCRGYVSLGQLRYLSAMARVDLVIGNSSSGIIETPAFHIPTVNIGDRQKGRLRADSVIDCGCSTEEIVIAITLGLSPDFRKKAAMAQNPYGDGNAAERIVEILKEYDFSESLQKRFYDVDFAEGMRDVR